jgi:hypothetical protein
MLLSPYLFYSRSVPVLLSSGMFVLLRLCCLHKAFTVCNTQLQLVILSSYVFILLFLYSPLFAPVNFPI